MVNKYEKSKENAKLKGAFVQRAKRRNIKKDKNAKFEKNKFVDKKEAKKVKKSDEQIKEEADVSDIDM